jgi:catechol 2,3-dioxygenase-like lactoylglutathione lyase family enzyme
MADELAHGPRGVHHVTLWTADVARTVAFYRDVLEFRLTGMHDDGAFFDVGNGNLLAFANRPPGDPAAPAAGPHHIAISVGPARWSYLKAKLAGAGVPYRVEAGTSVRFRDPDGARLELIADPLGDLHGEQIL